MDLAMVHLPREKPTHLISVAVLLDRVHPGPKEPPTVAVATRDPLPRQRRSGDASRTLGLGLPWWWAPEGRTGAMGGFSSRGLRRLDRGRARERPESVL